MSKDQDLDYTKFEKARLIGARALQISLGAPIMVSNEEGDEPIDIARREFENGALPLTVKRPEDRRRPSFLEA